MIRLLYEAIFQGQDNFLRQLRTKPSISGMTWGVGKGAQRSLLVPAAATPGRPSGLSLLGYPICLKPFFVDFLLLRVLWGFFSFPQP